MFFFSRCICAHHVDNDIALKSLKGMSDRVHGFTAGQKHIVYLTTCMTNENIHTHDLSDLEGIYAIIFMFSLGPRQFYIII